MYGIVTVSVLYKGKPLGDKFFNEHPEIQNLYPSKEDFYNLHYLPLLQEARLSGTNVLLVISENSITVNGLSR
jgi:hypothetical protein